MILNPTTLIQVYTIAFPNHTKCDFKDQIWGGASIFLMFLRSLIEPTKLKNSDGVPNILMTYVQV